MNDDRYEVPLFRSSGEMMYLENLARLVLQAKELERDPDVVSVSSYGAHLTPAAFDRLFGTSPNITREDATQYIKCSTTYGGAQFFALFKKPEGINITTGETKTIRYINIREVELKP
jgi:hypothetical protein